MRREIRSNDAPAPIGPYSQALETTQPAGAPGSGAVFCSGQIGVDPAEGKLVEGIEAQTRRTLTNLKSVLEAGGLSLHDVVKVTVFMVDLAGYPTMNQEYAKHFSAPFPARSTVQVSALPKGALVEIDAVAMRS